MCILFLLVVPSQVQSLVGSEIKGQIFGAMVAAGAGRAPSCAFLLTHYIFNTLFFGHLFYF